MIEFFCIVFGYSNSFATFIISGTNKVILIGANQQEIELTRSILKNRWPYPCSRDQELILDDKNKAWLFKLKRHPWAVSYGHKHLDRAAEIAQSFLHKPIAPPKNTDADSGKSIIIFLLRVSFRLNTALLNGILDQKGFADVE